MMTTPATSMLAAVRSVSSGLQEKSYSAVSNNRGHRPVSIAEPKTESTPSTYAPPAHKITPLFAGCKTPRSAPGAQQFRYFSRDAREVAANLVHLAAR